MPKREAGNQLTKDDYEAGGGRSSFGGSNVDFKRGISRLSAEELKKRRILKVKDPASGGGGGGGSGGDGRVSKAREAKRRSMGASSSASSSPKKASNPFASVNLTSSTTPSSTKFSFSLPTSSAPPPPKTSISAAFPGTTSTTAAPAATTSKLTFGLGSTITATTGKTNTGFGNWASSSATSSTSTSSSSTGAPGTTIRKRSKQYAEKFLETMIESNNLGKRCELIVDLFQDYQTKLEEAFYENKNNSKSQQKTSTSTNTTTTTTATTTTTTTTTPSFSFGAASSSSTTSSTTLPTTSFGAGNLFGSKTTTATTLPAIGGVGGGTTDDGTTTEGDDNGDNKGESSLLSSVRGDPDWTDLHVISTAIFHYREKKRPVKFASGSMKIQKHNTDGTKCRMVMRNAAGKVQFNVQISKDMTFKSQITKSKKGPTRYEACTFFGINGVNDDDDNKNSKSNEKSSEMFTLKAAAVPEGGNEQSLEMKLQQIQKDV